MKEKKENQISQEAQEKINNIGRMINEAKDEIDWFITNLCVEVRKNDPSDYDDYDEDEPFMFWREFQCLENLCDELEIDVPVTFDVYLRDYDKYRIETVEGDELLVCTDIEEVIHFLLGWGYSCANSVIRQAQKRIGNLLETGC